MPRCPRQARVWLTQGGVLCLASLGNIWRLPILRAGYRFGKSMNSVFLLGTGDNRLAGFLQRLGYAVLQPKTETWAEEIVEGVPDIIVVDGQTLADARDVCVFLRSQRETKEVPIVFLSAPLDEDSSDAESLQILGNIEEIAAPYSVGGVVAAIATQLRLRKLAGGDESKATLAEVNLTLREHNERFRRELEEACSIQKGLLPEKLPSDSRFELAASYQPLEEVGGDWYFAAQDETGALTLSISDVSGHGLSAAFISSMTKLATSAAYDPSIALQLQKTASLLGPQLPAGRFVTMAMCRYFPDSGRLQWARAGHPPAVVVRRNGETTQLQGDGFPVGFVDDATFEQLEEVLEPGDMVLMVTDGITEVQNRAMQVFGVDSLVQVLLSSGSNASAAQVLHNVVDAIDTFREGRVLKDDVTLLLLKRIS